MGPAFAAHAAQRLEAMPLASASSAPPAKIALAAPRTDGPAGVRAGRPLALRRAVLHRYEPRRQRSTRAITGCSSGSRSRSQAETPVAGPPEQLTETSWNCEYPAPFADRLIATCSQDGSLDVYSLPLDGEVPAELDDADARERDRRRRTRASRSSSSPAGASRARRPPPAGGARCSRWRWCTSSARSFAPPSTTPSRCTRCATRRRRGSRCRCGCSSSSGGPSAAGSRGA